MTKATKAKLDNLTKTVSDLYGSAAKKDSTIKFLTFGIIAVVGVVIFIVFLRKRRK